MSRGRGRVSKSSRIAELLTSSHEGSGVNNGSSAFSNPFESLSLNFSSMSVQSVVQVKVDLFLKCTSKKNTRTRERGVKTLLESLNDASSTEKFEIAEALALRLASFYPELALDNSRTLRCGAQRILAHVIDSVSTDLLHDQISSAAGAWICAIHDADKTVRDSALLKFAKTMDLNTLKKLVKPIVSWCWEQMFEQTPDTMSDPRVFSLAEREQKYVRVVAGSVNVLCYLCASLKGDARLKRYLHKMYTQPKFWALFTSMKDLVIVQSLFAFVPTLIDCVVDFKSFTTDALRDNLFPCLQAQPLVQGAERVLKTGLEALVAVSQRHANVCAISNERDTLESVTGWVTGKLLAQCDIDDVANCLQSFFQIYLQSQNCYTESGAKQFQALTSSLLKWHRRLPPHKQSSSFYKVYIQLYTSLVGCGLVKCACDIYLHDVLALAVSSAPTSGVWHHFVNSLMALDLSDGLQRRLVSNAFDELGAFLKAAALSEISAGAVDLFETFVGELGGQLEAAVNQDLELYAKNFSFLYYDRILECVTKSASDSSVRALTPASSLAIAVRCLSTGFYFLSKGMPSLTKFAGPAGAILDSLERTEVSVKCAMDYSFVTLLIYLSDRSAPLGERILPLPEGSPLNFLLNLHAFSRVLSLNANLSDAAVKEDVQKWLERQWETINVANVAQRPTALECWNLVSRSGVESDFCLDLRDILTLSRSDTTMRQTAFSCVLRLVESCESRDLEFLTQNVLCHLDFSQYEQSFDAFKVFWLACLRVNQVQKLPVLKCLENYAKVYARAFNVENFAKQVSTWVFQAEVTSNQRGQLMHSLLCALERRPGLNAAVVKASVCDSERWSGLIKAVDLLQGCHLLDHITVGNCTVPSDLFQSETFAVENERPGSSSADSLLDMTRLLKYCDEAYEPLRSLIDVKDFLPIAVRAYRQSREVTEESLYLYSLYTELASTLDKVSLFQCLQSSSRDFLCVVSEGDPQLVSFLETRAQRLFDTGLVTSREQESLDVTLTVLKFMLDDSCQKAFTSLVLNLLRGVLDLAAASVEASNVCRTFGFVSSLLFFPNRSPRRHHFKLNAKLALEAIDAAIKYFLEPSSAERMGNISAFVLLRFIAAVLNNVQNFSDEAADSTGTLVAQVLLVPHLAPVTGEFGTAAWVGRCELLSSFLTSGVAAGPHRPAVLKAAYQLVISNCSKWGESVLADYGLQAVTDCLCNLYLESGELEVCTLDSIDAAQVWTVMETASEFSLQQLCFMMLRGAPNHFNFLRGLKTSTFAVLLQWSLFWRNFVLLEGSKLQEALTLLHESVDFQSEISKLVELLLNLLTNGETLAKNLMLEKLKVGEFCVEYIGDYGNYVSTGEYAFAAHHLYLVMLYVPDLVRSALAVTELGGRFKSLFANVLQRCICPAVIRETLFIFEKETSWDCLLSKNPTLSGVDLNALVLKVNHYCREIKVEYAIEDSAVSFAIKLPAAYPLHEADIDLQANANRGTIDERKWRTWLLQLKKILSQQRSPSSLVRAVVVWLETVKGWLSGASECSICYSIINSDDKSFANKVCGTCNNSFHGRCLFKVTYMSYCS